MTVVVLERAPRSLRGHLTRWMLEVRAGVYVGTLSLRVRDSLWALVEARIRQGAAVMIFRARTEQGFGYRS